MALGTISESSLPKTAKATALFPPTKKLRAAGGTAGNPAATRPVLFDLGLGFDNAPVLLRHRPPHTCRVPCSS